MDISTIQAAITSVSALISALGEIQKTKRKLDSLEYQEQLIKIKEHLLEANKERHLLLEEIQDLRQQLELADELQFDNENKIYWRIKGSQKEGPFCSVCYGEEKKLFPLQETDPQVWSCPKCKNSFEALESRLKKRKELKALSRSHRSY